MKPPTDLWLIYSEKNEKEKKEEGKEKLVDLDSDGRGEDLAYGFDFGDFFISYFF